MSTRTPARIRAFATVVAGACVAVVTLVSSGAGAAIVATVPLGTTAEYAVLAGSTVTNTGPSVLNGSLGLSPGTSVTGFPPGTVVAPGTVHIADAPAAQAQSDLTAAYVNAAGRPLDATTSADLANLTLQGGVYAGPSKGALSLTGPLTLDGAGNASSVFIFQTDSTLTTASGSTIRLINGAQACNVFWQVGSSATLGTDSVFAGNILALTSVSLNSGVTVQGRALARNGAVTLIDDTFTPTACAAATTTTNPTTSTSSTTAPTTATTTPVGPVPTTAPVTGTGGSATPTGAVTDASPVASNGGSGTGTGTPTARITTSSPGPGGPTGGLARTGSSLGLTAAAGIALIALGAAAVRVGRTED